jgi:hypothetical protein
MMLGREGSVRTYPEIGVPDPHHPLSSADIPINLFVQLMNCVGLETERFAHSTGQLDLCA